MGCASSSLKEGRMVDRGSDGRLSARDTGGELWLLAGEGKPYILGESVPIRILSNLFPFERGAMFSSVRPGNAGAKSPL